MAALKAQSGLGRVALTWGLETAERSLQAKLGFLALGMWRLEAEDRAGKANEISARMPIASVAERLGRGIRDLMEPCLSRS